MTYRHRLVALMALVCGWIFPINVAHADIKDFVVKLQVNLHPDAADLFMELSEYFESIDLPNLQGWFEGMALGPTGSGFIFVDDDGTNYIVTNRHVVETAQSVDASFEPGGDRSNAGLEGATVVYVDTEVDVAFLQLPNMETPFEVGMILEDERPAERTDVVAAGFPGLLSEAIWQIADGKITNQTARIKEFDDERTFLQHDATISGGSSGGPLMIEDDEAPGGFRVVGVNTYSFAVIRENTFAAIPTEYVLNALDRAKENARIMQDAEGQIAQLELACEELADLLMEDDPDYDRLSERISYDLVGRRGIDSFYGFSSLLSGRELEDYRGAFIDNPIFVMRGAILGHMYDDFRDRGLAASISFKEIDESQRNEILDHDSVRTVFSIGGEDTSIYWIREHGTWRVSEVSLRPFGPARNTGSSRGNRIRRVTGNGEEGGPMYPVTTNIGLGISFIDFLAPNDTQSFLDLGGNVFNASFYGKVMYPILGRITKYEVLVGGELQGQLPIGEGGTSLLGLDVLGRVEAYLYPFYVFYSLGLSFLVFPTDADNPPDPLIGLTWLKIGMGFQVFSGPGGRWKHQFLETSFSLTSTFGSDNPTYGAGGTYSRVGIMLYSFGF